MNPMVPIFLALLATALVFLALGIWLERNLGRKSVSELDHTQLSRSRR